MSTLSALGSVSINDEVLGFGGSVRLSGDNSAPEMGARSRVELDGSAPLNKLWQGVASAEASDVFEVGIATQSFKIVTKPREKSKRKSLPSPPRPKYSSMVEARR